MLQLSKDIVELYNGNEVILVNPKKSSWIKIPTKWYEEIKVGDAMAEERIKSYLIKYSLLEESNVLEKSYYGKVPFSVYLFLTRKCNLECSFCSMRSSPSFKEKGLGIEEWKDIIDQLREYKIKRIILTGGEPTLYDCFKELVEYIRKNMDCEIILSTNGVHLNSKLKTLIAESISRVDISWESIYGEYPQLKKQLRQNVTQLIEIGANVHLSYVMTKENRKYVQQFLDDALSYNVEIDLKIVSPIVNGKEYKDILLEENAFLRSYLRILNYVNKMKLRDEQLEKIKSLISITPKPALSCGGGNRGIMAVYPDGKIYPCHSVAREDYIIGDLRKGKLKDFLEYKDFDTQEIFRVDNQKYCQKCSIRYFCQGRCAGEISKLSDTYQKPLQCEFKKILINYYLWDYKPKKNVREIFIDIEDRVQSRLEELEMENGKNSID